jgi:hypothetical protein
MRSPKILSFIALMAISFSIASPVLYAQMPNQPVASVPAANPGIGMILFPVQRGADGQQYLTTRAGYQVALPGLGIDPNATQVAAYQDAQNNFWYINRNGQPTAVSPPQMQNIMSQIQQQQMMRQSAMPKEGGYPPQSMPPPQAPTAAPQQSTVINNPAPSSGASGSSALGTGLSAGLGAAVGAGLSNAIYNNNNNQYPYGGYGYGGMPYGTPVYREPSGQYYYNNPAANGTKVYVAPNASNTPYFNQYQQQGNWSDKDKWAANTRPISATAPQQFNPQQASNARSQAQAGTQPEQSGRRGRFGRSRSEQLQGTQLGGQQGGSRRSRRARAESELSGASGGRFNR